MFDNLKVGWVSFTQEEVKALQEAQQSLELVFGLLTPQKKADLYDEKQEVIGVLKAAADYVQANIGRPSPRNPYLPSVDGKGFPILLSTFARINAAAQAAEMIFAWVSAQRPDAAKAEQDVREGLRSMRAHVYFCLTQKYPTQAYRLF